MGGGPLEVNLLRWENCLLLPVEHSKGGGRDEEDKPEPHDLALDTVET